MSEESQHQVAEAMLLISPIRGLSDEWSATGKLYDTIKDHWHVLDSARGEITGMDEIG